MPLSINEIQMLFHVYENNNSSLFNYQEMIIDILNVSRRRIELIENLFKSYQKNLNNSISLLNLDNLKIMFEADKHPLYLIDNVSVNYLKEDYINFVNSFESIFKVKSYLCLETSEHSFRFKNIFGVF